MNPLFFLGNCENLGPPIRLYTQEVTGSSRGAILDSRKAGPSADRRDERGGPEGPWSSAEAPVVGFREAALLTTAETTEKRGALRRSTLYRPLKRAGTTPPVDLEGFRSVMREAGVEEIVEDTLEIYLEEAAIGTNAAHKYR